MRKIGIYLSILVLLLASCKNDSEILRNMKPLEQYYKKYTVQQLVEKIMKDNGAKSVGIHFDLTKLNDKDSESGLCAFRGVLIFSEGTKEGYGTLKEDCGLPTRNETFIKYNSNGEIIKASGQPIKFFKTMTFLFETLDLDIKSYKVKKTEKDSKRGEQSLYLGVDSAFQRQIFQSNFPTITTNYEAEHIVIMKYTSYDLITRFYNNNDAYHYHEILSWENEVSDEPRLNFEKEAGQKNE